MWIGVILWDPNLLEPPHSLSLGGFYVNLAVRTRTAGGGDGSGGEGQAVVTARGRRWGRQAVGMSYGRRGGGARRVAQGSQLGRQGWCRAGSGGTARGAGQAVGTGGGTWQAVNTVYRHFSVLLIKTELHFSELLLWELETIVTQFLCVYERLLHQSCISVNVQGSGD